MMNAAKNSPTHAPEMSLLKGEYDRLVQGELSRDRIILDGLERIWQGLPEQQRPRTIPFIFGRTYDENFISTYLAHVLDPAHNGIGPEPLQRLLALAGCEANVGDYETVTIEREYHLGASGRIDLLIRLDDAILLGIENKILAAEGANQTAAYARALPAAFRDHEHYFIFLTRDGQRARSRDFKPVSYQQLLDAFAAIRYDWPADIRASVLWEDFLDHIRHYITIGGDSMELSERGRLYIEHYKMLTDLQKAYEQDASAFLDYAQNSIAEAVPGEQWEQSFSFSPTRTYQQVYKPSWNGPHPWIHYEYQNFSRLIFTRDSFLFFLEVERNRADEFFALFDARQPALAEKYRQLGIAYRPSQRKNAVAWKEYSFKPEPDELVKQMLHALDEFSFLTPVVDDLLAELRETPSPDKLA